MDYAAYFLNSRSSIVELETIELSHPNFTQTYFCVRNAPRGLTAKLETGVSVDFQYYPMQIQNKGAKNDLDSGLTISFGDLGEVLPKELDSVSSANGFNVKPVILYRTYRSDDLSAPMFGPMKLEVATFAFSQQGATFDAAAPALNLTSTGELYAIDRFPMLRGLL